ncbi:MAG: S41 family peptidase, partial [Arachnia sp.]
WSVKADGSDLQQHTQHTMADGYVRDATTDETTVVYHSRGRLYAVPSLARGQVYRIDVDIALGDPEPVSLSPTERLEALAPDHGGDGSVIDWRGSAWYLTHRGGPARALSDLPGVRIREPRLLGATGKAVWASDAEGEDCLEIMPIDGDGDPRRLGQGRLGRVLDLVANAEGTKIAVASHDGTVFLVDVARASIRKLGRSGNGEVTGLVFSPDGRYLVWREAVAGEGAVGRLVGVDLVDDAAFTLTSGHFNDFSPAFSHDGKYLYFLSSRTIDPTYDELGFDLSFTSTVRPWVIPLRAEDAAPFGPTVDGWSISDDDAKSSGGSAKSESSDKSDGPAVLVVEGAEARMTPLPVAAGRYQALATTSGGVLWRSQIGNTGELGTGRAPGEEPKESVNFYDIAKRKLSVVVEACDEAWVSGDGRQLVVRSGEDVWVQSAEAKPDEDDDAKVNVDLSRLRRQILPRDEWRQMFDENARLMRDHFWREDLDGVDWAEVTAGYRPIIERLATHDDLVDLLWEVGAELNTSHAYVVPATLPAEASGLGRLGAEFSRNVKGEIVIDRILEGESSDPSARSPLRAAGVAARPGDVIAAVDGRPTMEVADIGVLLEGAANKVLELTIARRRMKRRVAVVPIASESSLRYQEWVRGRVAYTKEKSQGRVGYIHVPDMMAHGWAQFQRMIDQATRCEAVIADVRFNAGGHTSELVIERLSRQVVGWSRARHFDDPIAYPTQGLRGPLVFVTNSWAGSDGDIVTAAAQNLRLGPVVGERSWGGVVGIDGRFALVDGTVVTQPRYGFSFLEQGWGVENYGTEPDIEVPMGPADWESDADIQLDAAIAEALQQLDDSPAVSAPDLDPPRASSASC